MLNARLNWKIAHFEVGTEGGGNAFPIYDTRRDILGNEFAGLLYVKSSTWLEYVALDGNRSCCSVSGFRERRAFEWFTYVSIGNASVYEPRPATNKLV